MNKKILLLVFVLFVPAALQGQDIDIEKILLYAPFDGSADARLARGQAKAVTEGKIEYREGRVGKALVVGKRTAHVGFNLKDNFAFEEGGIAFWAAPLDWDYTTEVNHSFIHMKDQEEFQIYYFFPSKKIFAKLGYLREKRIFNDTRGDNWQRGRWRHIVFNWSNTGVELYVDGYLRGGIGGAVRFPRAVGDVMYIGKYPELSKDSFTYKNDTLIDEFYIFKRPLDLMEIRRLMARGESGKKPVQKKGNENKGKSDEN